MVNSKDWFNPQSIHRELEMKMTLKRSYKGFTLIELLICIAIIALLSALSMAGLMSAMNYVKKLRAKGEIEAMNTGLIHFNDDNGFYPNVTFINKTGAGASATYDPDAGNYRSASAALFLALIGKTAWDPSFANPGKPYVELKANWVFTNGSATAVSSSAPASYLSVGNFGSSQGAMKDPWGKPYGYYYTPPPENNQSTATAAFNQNGFDIWTTCGVVQSNSAWIGNWATH